MRKKFDVVFIDEFSQFRDDTSLEIGIHGATTDEVAEFIESYGFKIGKDTYGFPNSYYETLEKEYGSAVVSIYDENAYADGDGPIDEKYRGTVIVELSTTGMKNVPKFYINFFKAIFSPYMV